MIFKALQLFFVFFVCSKATADTPVCADVYCDCPYGANYYDVNGCPMCFCKEDPCNLVLCPENTACQVDYASGKAKCVPIEHPGLCPLKIVNPKCVKCCNDGDCAADQKCCNKCCRPACPKPRYQGCNFGLDWFYDANGCQAVRCKPDPCLAHVCKANFTCQVNPDTLKAVCIRITPKRGSCPLVNVFVLAHIKCQFVPDLCTYDANCPGNQKCCPGLCQKVCVAPCLTATGNCTCSDTFLGCNPACLTQCAQ